MVPRTTLVAAVFDAFPGFRKKGCASGHTTFRTAAWIRAATTEGQPPNNTFGKFIGSEIWVLLAKQCHKSTIPRQFIASTLVHRDESIAPHLHYGGRGERRPRRGSDHARRTRSNRGEVSARESHGPEGDGIPHGNRLPQSSLGAWRVLGACLNEDTSLGCMRLACRFSR